MLLIRVPVVHNKRSKHSASKKCPPKNLLHIAWRAVDRNYFNNMAKAGKKSNRLNIDAQIIESDSIKNSYESYAQAELAYLKIATKEHRKKYAQYFTSPPVAQLMCNWIAEKNPATILDPSVGVGVFISALVEMRLNADFYANDIDKNILQFAKAVPGVSRVNFQQKDFLLDTSEDKYDAIIANPPYLRHHDFHYDEDIFSLIGSRNSIAIPKTMNIYGLFVLEICRRLNDGGRAAIIIPSEWMNSNFGKPLKDVLVRRGLLKNLLLFSHEDSQFAGALTTACVLFIEKSGVGGNDEIKTLYLTSELKENNINALIRCGVSLSDYLILNSYPSDVLVAAKKWDHLIRASFTEERYGSIQLKNISTTKRGIATGANEYFLLSADRAKELRIRDESLTPCIGRAADVKGLIFNQEDLGHLIDEGISTHLLTLRSNLDEHEALYIKLGEEMELPLRHLLSVRKLWYRMENRQPAPILAAVQGRGFLRFVRNKTNAVNLTAFHGIYPIDRRPIYLDALTVLLNSQMVQEGSKKEQRIYGGGLIKVQPDDLLDIQIPDLRMLPEEKLIAIANHLPLMDRLYREKQSLQDCHTIELHRLLSNVAYECDSLQPIKHGAGQADLFEA